MKDRVRAAADFVQARPALSALALGLVSACAFPPLHLWPLGIAALAVLVWLIHTAHDWRAAAWRGYVFGWAHLTLANNWIATAFTHQAKMPEFLGWLAVPLLCVYLAVYPGLAALAAHCVTRRLAPPEAGIAVSGTLFAAAWIVAEWVRGWAFTGYPWPPLGLMLLGSWHSPGIAIVLPWVGTYALSGLAILIAAGLCWIVRRQSRAGAVGLLAAIVLGMTASPFLVGSRSDTEIRYALIQPQIPQEEINDGSKFEEQFQRIARLTRPGNDGSRLVLWPESAIPDYLEEGYPQRYYARMTAGADPGYARERIGEVIGSGSTLLTGVVNLDIGMREDGSLGAVSARNSVLAIGGDGAIEAHYAKAHLVPYGEYLPMEWALERLGLARLTAGTIAYVAGPGPRTLDLGKHGRAGIQICYEIVFSGQVTDPRNRPDYIFNPSNDGWFGSWGPPQHLAQARMRAIEEGLPVLRSTTTGISAVIDANGMVRGAIGIGEAGRLEGLVPQAKPPTLFARLGNALALAWAGVLTLLALAWPRLLALRRSRG